MAACEDAIAQQLECPVCMETFKEARYLACLHTFCAKCIEDFADDDYKITCPECRQETFIDEDSGTSMLKPNILANRMVETLENKNANHNHKGTKEKEPVCKKHRPIRKKYFCDKCQELICSECSMENHANHATRVSLAKTVVMARTQAMQQILDDSETKHRQRENIIRILQEKYNRGHALLGLSIMASKSKFDELFKSLTILKSEFDEKLQDMIEVQKEDLAETSVACELGRDLLAGGNEEDILTTFEPWLDAMKADGQRELTIPIIGEEENMIRETAHTCLTHVLGLAAVLSELQANDTSPAADNATGKGLQKASSSSCKRQPQIITGSGTRKRDAGLHVNDPSPSQAAENATGKVLQKARSSSCKTQPPNIAGSAIRKGGAELQANETSPAADNATGKDLQKASSSSCKRQPQIITGSGTRKRDAGLHVNDPSPSQAAENATGKVLQKARSSSCKTQPPNIAGSAIRKGDAGPITTGAGMFVSSRQRMSLQSGEQPRFYATAPLKVASMSRPVKPVAIRSGYSGDEQRGLQSTANSALIRSTTSANRYQKLNPFQTYRTQTSLQVPKSDSSSNHKTPLPDFFSFFKQPYLDKRDCPIFSNVSDKDESGMKVKSPNSITPYMVTTPVSTPLQKTSPSSDTRPRSKVMFPEHFDSARKQTDK
ncbi:uncharacterized protein [Diadema antillarum]|uniref:uncharacterized protein isoform X1 n=1 Tax=Diadema antillarum TaxID=105358 RepID=UPI003A850093